MPTVQEQRAMLEAAACDLVLCARGPEFVANRRVTTWLFRTKAGDQIFVESLAVLMRTAGQAAQVLGNLLDVGASVHLSAGAGQFTLIDSATEAGALLAILADHERRLPSQGWTRVQGGRQGGSRQALSRYQLEYARKLFDEGESLRSIGLLFQLPPAQVWELVAPEHAKRRGAGSEATR